MWKTLSVSLLLASAFPSLFPNSGPCCYTEFITGGETSLVQIAQTEQTGGRYRAGRPLNIEVSIRPEVEHSWFHSLN